MATEALTQIEQITAYTKGYWEYLQDTKPYVRDDLRTAAVAGRLLTKFPILSELAAGHQPPSDGYTYATALIEQVRTTNHTNQSQ